MLSIPDMAVLGAAALLFFGPEQLPRVARKAGNVMREIQNTSQSFIRELERAADVEDAKDVKPYEPPPYEPAPYDAAADDATAYDATAYEPPHYDTSQYEPAAPDPEAPGSEPHSDPLVASEKLAEPRPALDLQTPETGGAPSSTAEAPPEADHTPHL
ncbi:MAG TPA: twin-arginine translocase TatA/TatE family subunit [Candidatus Elarobacter sp.]|jgi:Sec-independent protein translocase protein TatA